MEPSIEVDFESSINDYLVSKISNYQSQGKKNYSICIQGQAGVGKTVLTRYLSQMLTSSSSLTDLVFLIPLNRLSKEDLYPSHSTGYSLIDILSIEVFDRPLEFYERKLLEEVIENKRIIWILDGLDEFLPNLTCFGAAMQELKSQRVIIASRIGVKHRCFKTFTDTVELVGYSSREVELYIDETFKEETSSLICDMKENFKKELRNNLELRQICQTPFILSWICTLLKAEDKEVLNKKNRVELFDYFISFSSKRAFKRELNTLLHTKMASGIDQINQRKLLNYYRDVIRFMIQLAYEKGPQIVQFTLKDLSNTASRMRISLDDRDAMKKDLREIGLFIPDAHGGGFRHRLFQEYFVARGLIKKLKRTVTATEGNNFIEEHKWDHSYREVFVFLVQRLLLQMKAKPKKERDIHTFLQSILHRFIHKSSIYPIENNKILQIIPLLNAYCRHFEDCSVYFQAISWCHQSIDLLLNHVIEEKIQKDDYSEGTNWQNSRAALETLFQFFADHRLLSKEVGLTEKIWCIVESCIKRHSATSSSSSSSALPFSINSKLDASKIEILRRCFRIFEWSHALDAELLEKLKSNFQVFSQDYMVTSGLIVLLLDYIRRFAENAAKENPDLLRDVQMMLQELFIRLMSLYQADNSCGIRAKYSSPLSFLQDLDHDEAAYKIKKVLSVLLNTNSSRDLLGPIYEKLKDNLVEFTQQMLQHLSVDWLPYWEQVFYVDRDILKWEERLRETDINRLKDFITSVYNTAYGEGACYFELRSRVDRDQQYDDVGSLLEETINLMDHYDTEYGDMLIDKVITIHHTGVTGHVKSRGAPRKENKERAKSLLLCYRPDLIANPKCQLNRLKKIFFSFLRDEGMPLLSHLENLQKIFANDPERRKLIDETLQLFRISDNRRAVILRGIPFTSVKAGPITEKYTDLRVVKEYTPRLSQKRQRH